MYSDIIRPKVEEMFGGLRERVAAIVSNSFAADEAIVAVTRLVSSELTTRSKTILSDMLFALSDKLLETEFFSDISRQKKLYEINLRQEIFNKYQCAPSTTVDYQEASRALHALRVGGTMFVAGGVIEVGIVLVAGLPLSALAPVPVSLLIVASIGAAVADYYVAGPARNKKALADALDAYLVQAKGQFLGWFDEVEHFFNKRVEEIKRTM